MHVAFAAQKAQRDGIAVGHDGENDVVAIRQPLGVAVHLEKPGVALQQNGLRRLVFLETERPAADDVLRLPVDAVSRGKGFVGDRLRQNMLRQNRHACAKRLQKRCVDVRCHDSDGQVINFRHGEWFAVNLQGVASDIVNAGVVNHIVEREHHVVRRQRFAVAPAQIFPELERPRFAVRRVRPRFRQARLNLLGHRISPQQRREQKPVNVHG